MNSKRFRITLNSDKKLVSREAITQRILDLRLQAPQASMQNGRLRLNLALVIDRSGSMHGEKLEYVKQAACHVLDQLTEQDQAALVVYDNVIQVLARSTNITDSNRLELKQSIASLHAGNTTDLCAGWLTGCREIAATAQEGMISRTLLLTDGLANVGKTDPELIARHAFELYKDSISTSTFGVGHGFNEHLLEAMSNRGGGNFYYIPNPDRIPDIFLQEFKELVGITVRNVEIKLSLPGSFEWQVLGGWSSEYKDGHLHIYVGDILAEKLQDIYVKLHVPKAGQLSNLSLRATALGKDESTNFLEDRAEVTFEYAEQAEIEAEAVNSEVMQHFSTVDMADEATEALKLERSGQRDAAEQRLQTSLNRNRFYISAQEAIIYQQMSERMKNGMTEVDRKRSHWESHNRRRQKHQEHKKTDH